jgi:hypothetical protein
MRAFFDGSPGGSLLIEPRAIVRALLSANLI